MCLRIRIHNLDHAHAALLAARECGAVIALESPAGAALWQGIGWWRAMGLELQKEFPEAAAILDCGDSPGLALAALRSGIPAVRIDAPAAVLAKIADIADQLGAKAWPPLPQDDFIDLLDAADPKARCVEALSAG
jgi:hypothetical protein